jgi:glucose-1-phosphatase
LYNEGLKEGIVFDTALFQEKAREEIDSIKRVPSYNFLEDVLQYHRSKRAIKKGHQHFDKNIDVQLQFYEMKDGKIEKRLEPKMLGDLNVANMASDALILMYYEFPDSLRAFFKRDFSFDEMCKIANVKDWYGRNLFTAPIIAVNVSHCMLKNIYAEMNCNWHKFTFLCTHDSMIQSLLTALDVMPYSDNLRNTIEKDTPIGVKLLFEEWVDPNEKEWVISNNQRDSVQYYKRYIRARLIYQSTKQIQNMQVLDLNHQPMSYSLSFKGLEKVIYEGDTLYRYDDFMNHIEKTLDAYKRTAVGKYPWE